MLNQEALRDHIAPQTNQKPKGDGTPVWASNYPDFLWQPSPMSTIEWAGSGRIETAGERVARAAALGSLAVEKS